MAGRGVPAAAAAATAGRPRSRPNKVTKPPSRGRGAQSSIPTEHLEAHLAGVKTDQDPGSRQSSEPRDDDDDPDHDMESADQDQRQYDYAAGTAAAHALIANGPGTHTDDADIHPALHGLVPHPSAAADQASQGQAQAQAQQAFAMEAPMHAAAGGDGPRTAVEVSKESGYPELIIDSALSKRLSDSPGVRLAVQRRQDQGLNLKRRSNVEALLAHVSGQEAHSPCKSCHKGYGPWNGCIVVNGLMCGSCANCWFNASGSRCSFHETNLPQTQQHIPAVSQNALPQAASFSITPAIASTALGAIPAQLAPPPPQSVAAAAFLPYTGGSLDQWVRSTLDRSINDLRSGDPHVRFQARIDAAVRALAVVVAEYNDFLAVQEGPGGEQQQQQQLGGTEGPPPRPGQQDGQGDEDL